MRMTVVRKKANDLNNNHYSFKDPVNITKSTLEYKNNNSNNFGLTVHLIKYKRGTFYSNILLKGIKS